MKKILVLFMVLFSLVGVFGAIEGGVDLTTGEEVECSYEFAVAQINGFQQCIGDEEISNACCSGREVLGCGFNDEGNTYVTCASSGGVQTSEDIVPVPNNWDLDGNNIFEVEHDAEIFKDYFWSKMPGSTFGIDDIKGDGATRTVEEVKIALDKARDEGKFDLNENGNFQNEEFDFIYNYLKKTVTVEDLSGIADEVTQEKLNEYITKLNEMTFDWGSGSSNTNPDGVNCVVESVEWDGTPNDNKEIYVNDGDEVDFIVKSNNCITNVLTIDIFEDDLFFDDLETRFNLIIASNDFGGKWIAKHISDALSAEPEYYLRYKNEETGEIIKSSTLLKVRKTQSQSGSDVPVKSDCEVKTTFLKDETCYNSEEVISACCPDQEVDSCKVVTSKVNGVVQSTVSNVYCKAIDNTVPTDTTIRECDLSGFSQDQLEILKTDMCLDMDIVQQCCAENEAVVYSCSSSGEDDGNLLPDKKLQLDSVECKVKEIQEDPADNYNNPDLKRSCSILTGPNLLSSCKSSSLVREQCCPQHQKVIDCDRDEEIGPWVKCEYDETLVDSEIIPVDSTKKAMYFSSVGYGGPYKTNFYVDEPIFIRVTGYGDYLKGCTEFSGHNIDCTNPNNWIDLSTISDWTYINGDWRFYNPGNTVQAGNYLVGVNDNEEIIRKSGSILERPSTTPTTDPTPTTPTTDPSQYTGVVPHKCKYQILWTDSLDACASSPEVEKSCCYDDGVLQACVIGGPLKNIVTDVTCEYP